MAFDLEIPLRLFCLRELLGSTEEKVRLGGTPPAAHHILIRTPLDARDMAH
ncbi:hypothetical protein HMPREF9004_0894 [Schaalia cardiffensis F0333]|uniref:Uncharacterized protein n=1 Tax=Schaalia cardiffensis F0333 TaxID=888050 RepID=N6W733_9ACTO|nr:hypothetical protein HMPREF9004_0894 [Schaalia cardiffensis F0333]